MNYVLFNDTSRTNNPGCQGTVSCLRQILADNGYIEQFSIPVGFASDLFRACIARPLQNDHNQVRQIQHKPAPLKIPKWSPKRRRFDNELPTNKVSLEDWERAKALLADCVRNILLSVDNVIINGEGTLHHNQPSALALLAIAEIAKDLGRRVEIVNSTIQEMDPGLLKRVLTMCDRIIVREPLSLQYLESLQIPARMIPDCLFLYPKLIQPPLYQKDTCLYTPGVLARAKCITVDEISTHIKHLQTSGHLVTYLGIERGDEIGYDAASSLNASIIDVGATSWETIVQKLSRYELVVSGRYHIDIFALFAGRPIACLPSNTWKVEGLHRLFPTQSPTPTISLGSVQVPVLNVSQESLAHVQNCVRTGYADTNHLARAS